MPFQEAKLLFENPESTNQRYCTQFNEVEYKKPPEKWMIEAEKFVCECVENLRLPRNVKHLDFLKSKHLDENTIKLAMIGYNSEDRYIERHLWGLDSETNENGQNKKLWLPKGIVIPYVFEGEVLRIRVRRDNKDDNFGRYVVISGSSSRPMVFGTGPDYMVVESELDALLMCQECRNFLSIIGLGSASTKPKFDVLNTLKSARNILISLDNDPGGAKTARWWTETFPNIAKRWPPVNGKDPSEMADSNAVYAWAVSAFLNPYDKSKSIYKKVEIPGYLKNCLYSDTDSLCFSLAKIPK